MKVSVIVPVYNVDKYLEECLQSIENQTLKDIEVIIVNDGSTDTSPAICKKFADKNGNFIYIEKENGGLMSAWLEGVNASTGDYIGFVDSDDSVMPTMFETLYNKAIETNADIVMCGRKDVTLDGVKDVVDNYKEFYGEEDISKIHDNVYPSLKAGNVSLARWNKLFKRQIFMPNLKYCESKSRYCEDRFIVPACLYTAKTFAYVQEPLYVYRMRKSANSKTGSPKLLKAMEHLIEIQYQMLKDKGLYEKYKNDVELFNLNCIKVAFERNVFNVNDKKQRKINAKALLNEKNRKLVLEHKNDCVNKFGKYIYWSCKLNSVCVVLLGAKLFNYINKKDKGSWFN